MDKSRFVRALGEGQESRTLPHAAETRGKASICPDCQYCGDKHSFSEPNSLPDTDPENPLLKHYYCCCGNCALYMDDLTFRSIWGYECLDEL